jgi:hypothetical protein
LSTSDARGEALLDLRHLQLLSECGVTRYLPRSRAPVAVSAAEPAALTPVAAQARPTLPTSVVPTGAAPLGHVAAADSSNSNAAKAQDAALSFGPRSVRFAGATGDWLVLRKHLLRAFAATECATEAAVMFGGRGTLLTLPALGALAANPALKRQAWQALRALRRSTAV